MQSLKVGQRQVKIARQALMSCSYHHLHTHQRNRSMPITKRRVILSLFVLIATIAVVFVLYVIAALNWSYSTGERAGFLQKISDKGWICKTWEGELSLVALPGAAPEKFLFTVRDAEVAKQVNAAVGKRVALTYAQHKGLPTSCFGETDYFVVGVKEITQ